MTPLDTLPARSYDENTMNGRAVLREVLDEAPGSIRELAAEAGVSDFLLRAIRDDERNLTERTRSAVVTALRRWSDETADLADALEAADLEPSGREDDDG